MAEIAAVVNGLVALCLRSTRNRAAQPDTQHLGSALGKVESTGSSSDSDSEFTEKYKRLPQQQQRWKRLRWTGWSRKEGLVVKAGSTTRNQKLSRVWQATELPLRHMEIGHPFL